MSRPEDGYETVSAEESETVTSTAADRLSEVISEEKKPKDKKSEKAKDPEDAPAPKKKKEHKKLRHGAMSTVSTVIFVAAVVLVNIIATMLFKRYPLTLDLTKEGRYSISEQSEEYVRSIDTDVTVKVFAKEDAFIAVNDYTKQADEVLKRYAENNPHIKVEYVDIDSNPDIVSEYTDQSVKAYSIIVESLSKDSNGTVMRDEDGKELKRVRSVSLLDMVSFTDDFEQQVSSYGMSAEDYVLNYTGGDETTAFAIAVQNNLIAASTADQAFVSAIMGVTDPDPVVVSVLTGREESADVEYLRKLLLANGYTVQDVNITSEEIPADTDLCIVPSPTVDYMEAEITKLDNFVSNDGNMGKNLLYIASYNQQATPNLDEFLEEYNLAVGTGLVCENDKDHYYTQPFWTVSDDISTTFAEDIGEDAKILLFGSRPIKLKAEGEVGKMKIEALISTTDNAYVADEKTGDALENGKQVYAALCSRASFGDNGDTSYSNILLVGSQEMLSSEYLRFNQYANREYILSVLGGMTGKTSNGLVIEPKVITGNIFDITASQIRLLKIVFIGVIPVLTLGTGLVIWLRRKNR